MYDILCFIGLNIIFFFLETKLQFARDDPAFLVLLSGLLCGKCNKFNF